MNQDSRITLQTIVDMLVVICIAVLAQALLNHPIEVIDPYRNFAICLSILLAVMGVETTLAEDWVKKHRPAVILAFVLVGALAAYLSIRQADESAMESAQSRKDLKDTLIGGDSLCVLTLSGDTVIVMNAGINPLYTVIAKIIDESPCDQSFKPPRSGIRMLDLQIGDLPHTFPRTLDHAIPWKLHPTRRDFVIFFSARNGIWQEDLQYRLVDGSWQEAWRVIRAGEKKDALAQVDSKFPNQPPEWFDAEKELEKDLKKNE